MKIQNISKKVFLKNKLKLCIDLKTAIDCNLLFSVQYSRINLNIKHNIEFDNIIDLSEISIVRVSIDSENKKSSEPTYIFINMFIYNLKELWCIKIELEKNNINYNKIKLNNILYFCDLIHCEHLCNKCIDEILINFINYSKKYKKCVAIKTSRLHTLLYPQKLCTYCICGKIYDDYF